MGLGCRNRVQRWTEYAVFSFQFSVFSFQNLEIEIGGKSEPMMRSTELIGNDIAKAQSRWDAMKTEWRIRIPLLYSWRLCGLASLR